jgi:hypothetical protein
MNKYSVLLLYPDYLTDDEETYYTFVEAADVPGAISKAQAEAFEFNRITSDENRDPQDFKPGLVILGHHYDILGQMI